MHLHDDGHTSGRNMWQEYYIYNIILDTFIHLWAFVGFVTICNCSVQSRGLFKICYRHIERYQYLYLNLQDYEDEGIRTDIL